MWRIKGWVGVLALWLWEVCRGLDLLDPQSLLRTLESSAVLVFTHGRQCQDCTEIRKQITELERKRDWKVQELRFGELDWAQHPHFRETQQLPEGVLFRLFLRSGLTLDHRGPGTTSSLLAFLEETQTKRSQLPAPQLLTSEREFVAAKSQSMTLFFSVPKNSMRVLQFLPELQLIFPGIRVAYVPSDSKFAQRVLRSKWAPQVLQMVVLSLPAQPPLTLPSGFQGRVIQTHLENLLQTAIKVLDSTAVSTIFNQPGIHLVLFESGFGSSSEAEFTAAALTGVPETFFYISKDQDSLRTVLDRLLGRPSDDLPSVWALRGSGGSLKKFRLSSPTTSASLLAFVGRIKAGEEREALKFQKAPVSDSGFFKWFDAHSLVQFLADPSKDLLLGFVGREHPSCLQIDTLMEEIHNQLDPRERELEVGLIDFVHNDVENAQGKEFPFFQVYSRRNPRNPTLLDAKSEARSIVRALEKTLGRRLRPPNPPASIQAELEAIARQSSDL